MDTLKIQNFKCFIDIEIPIKPLTIFAGANGNGKSTAIQALLLLRQTLEENYHLNTEIINTQPDITYSKVSLNNKYLQSLGNSSYITNQFSVNNSIVLGLKKDNSDVLEIVYSADDEIGQLFLKVNSINTFINSSAFFKKEFYYLNTERIGPRVSQAIQFYDFPNTGYQGENVAQMIVDLNYTSTIEEVRRHPKFEKTPRLEIQVNAWLDEIIPGVSIIAKQSLETLTAQIQVANQFTMNSPTISTNVGFGISYVLPIIATGLIAEKGSYMVVENPEAHLHPSAQSKVGLFLAMVAKAGVNIIVETHSDHFINGIQIACARNEIEYEKVLIDFFSYEKDNPQPKIESITINKMGELSKWPRGFFDQSQIDFAELFKIRKG